MSELSEERLSAATASVTRYLNQAYRDGWIAAMQERDVKTFNTGYRRALEQMQEFIETLLSDETAASRLPMTSRIEDLDFRVRTFNCLKRAKYHTIADLLQLSDEILLSLRNFDAGCLVEVDNELGKAGHSRVLRKTVDQFVDDPRIMDTLRLNDIETLAKLALTDYQTLSVTFGLKESDIAALQRILEREGYSTPRFSK